MSFFDRFFGKEKKKSAGVAKDRLMIAIAADRENSRIPNLDQMRAEIISVLEKYISIDEIEISKERKGDMDMLEIEVVVKSTG
ncbi:cell division topological specificity factor MinE [Hydrogenimonas sp.]